MDKANTVRLLEGSVSNPVGCRLFQFFKAALTLYCTITLFIDRSF
jgi:hypothetical protein